MPSRNEPCSTMTNMIGISPEDRIREPSFIGGLLLPASERDSPSGGEAWPRNGFIETNQTAAIPREHTPGRRKNRRQPEITMLTGTNTYTAIVPAEAAATTATLAFRYCSGAKVCAMMRSSGGHSIAWKKPFNHQRTIIMVIWPAADTIRLHTPVNSKPAVIMIRGGMRSPKKPQIGWPMPYVTKPPTTAMPANGLLT